MKWRSQNHRAVEVVEDLWRLSFTILLLKHSHQEQVAQYHTQVTFKDLQGGKLHDLSVQSVAVLPLPCSKEVFADAQTEPLECQFMPIASCPVIWHHRKESVSILIAPSFQVFIHTDTISPRPHLLQAENPQLGGMLHGLMCLHCNCMGIGLK